VTRDRLRLSRLGHHEELREDGHALKVDAPCPQNLHDGKLVIHDEGEEGDGQEEEFDSERVMGGVVGGLELDIDEVEGGVGGGNEEDLHGRVVHAHIVRDQVQVSGRVGEGEEDLGLPTDP